MELGVHYIITDDCDSPYFQRGDTICLTKLGHFIVNSKEMWDTDDEYFKKLLKTVDYRIDWAYYELIRQDLLNKLEENDNILNRKLFEVYYANKS